MKARQKKKRWDEDQEILVLLKLRKGAAIKISLEIPRGSRGWRKWGEGKEGGNEFCLVFRDVGQHKGAYGLLI